MPNGRRLDALGWVIQRGSGCCSSLPRQLDDRVREQTDLTCQSRMLMEVDVGFRWCFRCCPGSRERGRHVGSQSVLKRRRKNGYSDLWTIQIPWELGRRFGVPVCCFLSMMRCP